MGEAVNRAYFCVGYETLRRALGLPENVTIRGIESDVNDVLYTHEFRVLIECPDLPAVTERGEMPKCTPAWEYLEGTVVFTEWWS